ncbi:MAG: ATP-binding protein [Nanoarchaeota archaeon]|nr:ATP-binding protein [Nanoarchaeota archaeon]
MRKLTILKVEPINFNLRNKLEREIVIKTFQKFLNSLDFPVQIVIATDTLNLDTYLAKLEERVDSLTKKTGKDYNTILDDFKKHMQNMIASEGLLNRSFYLVIPEKEEIGLQIQVGVCEELLKNMNLKFTKLKDDELMFTLSGFFNDLYQESDKKVPQEEYLYHTVAPKTFINSSNEVQFNNTFARTIAVKGYPRTVEEGFLDKIITLNGNFDISIHIQPYDIETMMVMLNKELQKQRGDLWSMEQKGIINPSLEIKYKDTRKVLEELQKGDEKMFNVSLYITCKGRSLDNLNLLTKKVESELNALLMIPHRPRYEQHKALKSVIPLGVDKLGIKRNITTKGLSAFFPFTSQFLQIDESGILLGLNKNNIPLIKDIFKLYNANGVVLASSGGGKSYFTKLMISRLLLNDTKVMVIDPQAEYVDLIERFNGQLITISRESHTIINPLDLMGHDYDEKKLTLLELFPIMLGQTSEIQKAVLDRALTSIYEEKGITNDKETWRKEPPIMGDLVNQLKRMSKDATQVEKETYRSLINRIEMYVTGVFSFLNKQTNLNFKNRFVCFNIGDMPSQVKPTIMFLILDYVYMKMKKDIERKILVIDEAWSLLQRTEDEGYIFKIVKTCRKFNLGLLLITQDVGDLVKSDAGKALLNNSEYTLLLRQKPSIIDQVEKTFHLSEQERERLLTATTGEGIIIISNEHSEIKIIASPEEHEVITTNADERLAKEREKANEVVTEYEKPTVDYGKGWFRKKDLKKEEVEELLKHGYVLSQQIGLYGGRQEEYLLKPRYNESEEHFFVIKIIEEYIRKYTEKIELLVSSNADIIFEYDNKKVAIEVETGAKLRKNNPRIENKVKLLNKNYGKDWFFVVTDWNVKEKYQKYGETFVRKEIPAILKKRYFSLGSNSAVRDSDSAKFERFEVQNLPVLRANNFETLDLNSIQILEVDKK